MRILGVSGSLQASSGNLTLLQTAARIAPAGIEVVLFDGLRDLPPFNPDFEGENSPAAVREWRRAISGCDAMLIATPEYGHSLPGALKNGIDWVIGSAELYERVVAITSAVGGAGRGTMGLGALRQTLEAVSAVIVGGEPIVRGTNFEADIADLLQQIADAVSRSKS